MLETPAYPPTTWLFEGAAFTLHPSEDVHWEVTRNGEPIGYLVYVLDAERWSIRLPDNDTAGIGASWDNWKDAVISLSDYARR